ncbi:hypothetical protein B0H14DRAFT_3731758 [Mycena olivaceomarginata]|nr:hypothetical protein B0H14DRAFT_3731758 [Mycena olivaceomarginata]
MLEAQRQRELFAKAPRVSVLVPGRVWRAGAAHELRAFAANGRGGASPIPPTPSTAIQQQQQQQRPLSVSVLTTRAHSPIPAKRRLQRPPRAARRLAAHPNLTLISPCQIYNPPSVSRPLPRTELGSQDDESAHTVTPLAAPTCRNIPRLPTPASHQSSPVMQESRRWSRPPRCSASPVVPRNAPLSRFSMQHRCPTYCRAVRDLRIHATAHARCGTVEITSR